MPEEKNPKRTIVVGDVHGQFDPFVKILRHARLVDQDLNWSGESHRLVQMGDILDRGPFSRKVDDLLDKIQQQAASAQGEVIRLIGNHELELLLSNFVISGFSKEEAKFMRDKLMRQVFYQTNGVSEKYRLAVWENKSPCGRIKCSKQLVLCQNTCICQMIEKT